MTAALDPDFWDRIAPGYAEQPVEDPQAFQRKIDLTRAHLTPGCTVLDVGCGTGSLALILAPDAGHVHGLDFSPEMMRIARGKAEDQGIDNVTFHTGALETLTGVEPGSLDVVMGWSLLHLVPDRADTLGRMFDLLRPGGSLVSSTVCLGRSALLYGPLLTVMRWVGKAPRVALLTPSQLQQEIREAGFVDVQQHEVGAKNTVVFITARKEG